MEVSASKKKILIICFTDTRYDARVARQIEFIKDQFDVSFAGHGLHLESGVNFIQLPKPPLTLYKKALLATLLFSRSYNEAYWQQYPYKNLKEKLKHNHFDLILANDIESLPLAFFLAKDTSAKIIFDAHEYAPRQFEDRLYWRLFFQKYTQHLCKKYIPGVSGMLTVCDGLAKEYHKNFFILPEVLTNAPDYQEFSPTEVKAGKVRLIHHGIVNISRKLENMLDMMDMLDDRFSLDIMVKTTPNSSAKTLAYFEELKKEAKNRAKVKFIPPVTSKEIVPAINKYDMGVFILEPINFNYTFALPNKLFDFIQARLGIAISPSVEMKRVVEKYQLGVVAEDFTPQSLAKKLNNLKQEEVVRFKQNSHLAARELSADKNKTLLINMIESVLAS